MKHTPLYDLHQELDARLVAFAGYAMPLRYRNGIRGEHLHTRSRAGLFDISHMGQIRIRGAGAAAWLETLVPSDIQELPVGRHCYTVLTNSDGGIIDDVMISRGTDHFSMVVNAACREKVLDYLHSRSGPDCEVTLLEDQALLALQGPAAARVMKQEAPEAGHIPFMTSMNMDLRGISCVVTRCGYTGEDGFELSLHPGAAESLVRRLLQYPEVEPAGLGARDTLRLEAGLCLYGQDIDEQTTPVEAGLGWLVAEKYRRQAGPGARFPGAARILDELRQSPARIRKGFRPAGKIPVRDGADILDQNDKTVGTITSGGFGPTVGGPIAMGYIDTAAAGADLAVVIREQRHRLQVTGLPFVKHRYFQAGNQEKNINE